MACYVSNLVALQFCTTVENILDNFPSMLKAYDLVMNVRSVLPWASPLLVGCGLASLSMLDERCETTVAQVSCVSTSNYIILQFCKLLVSHTHLKVYPNILCVCLCAGDLLSLLRWKSDPDGIGETLSRLERVDGAETVKFLQDVLDALFSMFSTEEGNSTQHSGHVFHSLVSKLRREVVQQTKQFLLVSRMSEGTLYTFHI